MLGVTLDTHLSITQHCNNIAVKVQQHNNVLKELAGSTWGCDKETLLTTYQAIGRSILSYCCPVWTPSLMDTNWSWLQQAQNYVLRIATGCLKMAFWVGELFMGSQDVEFQPSRATFSTTCQKIVVEVKASGPPHVIRLWLGLSEGMLPAKYPGSNKAPSLCQLNFTSCHKTVVGGKRGHAPCKIPWLQ